MKEPALNRTTVEVIKADGLSKKEIFAVMERCAEETKHLKSPWECLECGTEMEYQCGKFELICPNCGIHRFWY